MKLDQELAGSELVGIHGVQQDPFLCFDCHILSVELGRHRAPDLRCSKNKEQGQFYKQIITPLRTLDSLSFSRISLEKEFKCRGMAYKAEVLRSAKGLVT